MERFPDLRLVDAALVSRDAVNELLEIEEAVLVCLHQLKHRFPLLFSEAHVAEVVGKALEDVHLG